MVTGGELALGLGKVKRAAVGLCVACDEENEERNDGRNMALEYEPVPRTGLGLHYSGHLHGAGEYNCRYETEPERHFIRYELHGTTHGRNNAILVVTAPSGHEYTDDADARHGSKQEDAHVEVKNLGPLVPRQE